MSGTKVGGKQAAATNKLRYGADFYRTIGKLGGLQTKSTPAGFAADRERAKWAGRKGGLKSRRSGHVY